MSIAASTTTSAADRRRVEHRLRPLYGAALTAGLALWVPVEKLFMSELGFDATTVGVMAGVYAAMVPLLETPSGILADRWSRKGVLVVGHLAMVVGLVVMAAAGSVMAYVVGAAFFGVYLALASGTLDAMVFDVLREELDDTSGFERTLGRFRAVESGALAASAIGGGVLAALTSPRTTYVLTLPLLLLSVVMLLAFREPRLHETAQPEPLRRQVATTFRTVLQRGRLRPIVGLMVLTGVLLQSLLEFGPLWLVAVSAPAVLYGAQWFGVTGALGVGGLLAGRLHLDCRGTLTVLTGVLATAAVATSVTRQVAVVVPAQVVLVLGVMVLSVHLTAQLHESVPSTIRAGVASGVSTLTWLAILPFALVLGVVIDRLGVGAAGWLVTGVVTAVGAVLLRPASRAADRPASCPAVGPAEPALVAA
jgi:MFS family permease